MKFLLILTTCFVGVKGCIPCGEGADEWNCGDGKVCYTPDIKTKEACCGARSSCDALCEGSGNLCEVVKEGKAGDFFGCVAPTTTTITATSTTTTTTCGNISPTYPYDCLDVPTAEAREVAFWCDDCGPASTGNCKSCDPYVGCSGCRDLGGYCSGCTYADAPLQPIPGSISTGDRKPTAEELGVDCDQYSGSLVNAKAADLPSEYVSCASDYQTYDCGQNCSDGAYSGEWMSRWGRYAIGFGIFGVIVCGVGMMMFPQYTSCHRSKNTRGEFTGN